MMWFFDFLMLVFFIVCVYWCGSVGLFICLRDCELGLDCCEIG